MISFELDNYEEPEAMVTKERDADTPISSKKKKPKFKRIIIRKKKR